MVQINQIVMGIGHWCCTAIKKEEITQVKQAMKQALEDYIIGNYDAGIIKLIDANTTIDMYIDNQSQNSGKTASITNVSTDQRTIFIHKYAKLMYRLGQYRQCIQFLMDSNYSPMGYIPWKVIADCYRKLGENKRAELYYNRGLDFAKQQGDKEMQNMINCNKGLLLMNGKHFKAAQQLFTTILTRDPNNILVIIHLAQANILNKDYLHGLAALKRAFDLFKGGLLYRSYSKSNKRFISNTIQHSLNVIEFLRSEQLPFIMFEQSQMIRWFKDIDFQDITPSDFLNVYKQSERWHIQHLDRNSRMKFLFQNAALKEMALGMEFNFQRQYTTALNMPKYIDSLNPGWIAENFALLIPIVGPVLSKAIEYSNKQMIKMELQRISINIISLSYCIKRDECEDDNKRQFSRLMIQFIVQMVYRFRKTLIYYKPSNPIPAWHNFPQIAKKVSRSKQEVQSLFFGKILISPIFRYGVSLMQRIFERVIFNGEVYQGHTPSNRTKEEILEKLWKAGYQALQQDEDFLRTYLAIKESYQ